MFIYEENRLANNMHFSIEAIQAMAFWKTSGFFPRVFPQKNIVFQRKQFKIKFPQIFVSLPLIVW